MKFPPESWRPYMGRIACTLIGLIIGILLLTIGFWRTLLLVVIVGIAYLIGMYKDQALDINRLPLPRKWR